MYKNVRLIEKASDICVCVLSRQKAFVLSAFVFQVVKKVKHDVVKSFFRSILVTYVLALISAVTGMSQLGYQPVPTFTICHFLYHWNVYFSFLSFSLPDVVRVTGEA